MNSFHIKKFFKGEYSWKDIKDYFRGNFRHFLYYSKLWGWLLPKHIGEQINFRVKIMDKECYNNGECKLCGCKTINLQMTNKACEGDCYPPMMNKEDWNNFKQGLLEYEDDNYLWKYRNNIVTCIKKNKYKIRKRRKIEL